MPYELFWRTPEKVVHLALVAHPSIAELDAANDAVIKMLDASRPKVTILIDATHLQSGYHSANDLRATQKYMNHIRLDMALVVADNKLNRLITLMAFSLCRAKFMQFQTMEAAEALLRHRGLINDQPV